MNSRHFPATFRGAWTDAHGGVYVSFHTAPGQASTMVLARKEADDLAFWLRNAIADADAKNPTLASRVACLLHFVADLKLAIDEAPVPLRLDGRAVTDSRAYREAADLLTQIHADPDLGKRLTDLLTEAGQRLALDPVKPQQGGAVAP